MKYQLVLQFDGASIGDFDELLNLELELKLSLGSEHIVDGHDFGSGDMNIFIHTDQPDKAFLAAKNVLNNTNIGKVVAAYRDLEGETYSVIYPEGFEGEFCIDQV